jgi:hypothetical protein
LPQFITENPGTEAWNTGLFRMKYTLLKIYFTKITDSKSMSWIQFTDTVHHGKSWDRSLEYRVIQNEVYTFKNLFYKNY